MVRAWMVVSCALWLPACGGIANGGPPPPPEPEGGSTPVEGGVVAGDAGPDDASPGPTAEAGAKLGATEDASATGSVPPSGGNAIDAALPSSACGGGSAGVYPTGASSCSFNGQWSCTSGPEGQESIDQYEFACACPGSTCVCSKDGVVTGTVAFEGCPSCEGQEETIATACGFTP